MATPVTWTELRDRLRDQMLAAATSPQFAAVQVTHPDGSSVTYRTLDEMRRALGWAEQMAASESVKGRSLFLGVVPG
jgi:hypothetical protein